MAGSKDAEVTCQYKGNPADPLCVMSIPPICNAALSSTPFGGKVEVILRLAGLPYEAVPGDATDQKATPKGKFPVLRHGHQIVPDSSTIFDYLESTYPKEMSIFSPPDAETAALAHSVQRMLEEHTYFTFVYFLWQRKEVALEYIPRLMATGLNFPTFVLTLMARMIRPMILRTLHGQGMGRHSAEEVRERAKRDLDACSVLLQKSGAYLSGATPCQADCFLFAVMHLAHDGYSELSHRPVMVDVLLEQPVLVEFYWRMWPQVFAAAPGSPPDNRWPKKGAAAAASKASPARSRLLLPVLVAAAAVGAGVWFALNR